ncbi:Hsp70 family protein [Methyloversatilis sp. XJ19-49]|uniref:Hsp70 family protein n=1 Tax=Methyloversatilis sp. XJ19-49 TaxID=2963429 RepID=UPI00211BCBE3|nr:Hsp70 family protein [Methyloversatilis sp. XJ19-49]MCQ9377762.1 Hsp70 family protein [Methyloversatilis sp. XJ19-49]
MKHYIGIDLGTTNSAVSAYDGEIVRLFKSPDQNDVTPSAIFIDRRGNKYVGKRAYDNAARNPENAATLFKRLMGTSTPVKLPAVDLTLTPEECSAEILRVLFGYLPEDVRNDPDTGTVITVPAAFNQMQKDATMAAAEMAGMGKVALMQEPVAAVMSVMRHSNEDGMFLVYDLGGGTLDVAIAESINGRVSLLAHGGIAMCGGRDFDRALLDSVVKPWLLENFDLPEDFYSDARYTTLRHMATWAAEKAKIELSSSDEAVVTLDDSELRVRDEAGVDIYLDISLSRLRYDELISGKIEESIAATRETMEKAGLNAGDIGRVVFVGGPTQYKPLRDKVAVELGIAASTDVNPMTAVAEGAAVFAESIDWSSQNRGRKSGRGALSTGGGLDLAFNYRARTPDSKAKVVARIGGKVDDGVEFQVDSLDTGWSSGRVALTDGASVDVPLAKPGENLFKVFVFDAAGGPVKLMKDRIGISRTAAQIDAIPASHSIGVEAREKVGGRMILDYLVRDGDQLPKIGKKTFKAEESLLAGAGGSIKFKLWEGSIEDPVSDNRFIGMFEIRGSDFSAGVIAKGAELQCAYEVLDSGNIVLEVTVPSIGNSFSSGRNFYSRQEGQIDYSKATERLTEELEQIGNRLDEVESKIDDPRIAQARERLRRASVAKDLEGDPETAKQAMDDIQEAKKLLALVRKEHIKVIRQMELDKAIENFELRLRQMARPSETVDFENLFKAAQRAIDNNRGDFDLHLSELNDKSFLILWRQDWFVINRFQQLSRNVFLFPDTVEHEKLCQMGQLALKANDINKLRQVVARLDSIRVGTSGEDDIIASSNIVVS